jgi:hypothetical protein
MYSSSLPVADSAGGVWWVGSLLRKKEIKSKQKNRQMIERKSFGSVEVS